MKAGNTTIRTRFLLGMALMLLPLALFGAWTYYASNRTSTALEQMVEETLKELPRITHLKSLLMMAQMPPNDYLISGNPAEQSTFGYLADQINQALFDLAHASFGSEQERQLAILVEANWREAMGKADRIFARTDIHTADIDALMRDFDATLNKSINLASQLEREGYHVIEEQLAAARHSRRQLLQSLAVIGVIGMLIAAASGLLLARSVLRPLRALQRGAEAIGRGELEQDIDLERSDEFGQLAEAFNAMALNLKRSQGFLRDMAIRDGLTGLLNRREFHQRLDGEIERALRRETDLSLIMIDIDYFKRVNDAHGHLTGDEVLRGVATTISKQIRSMDNLARYGGEEFVIITPEPRSGAVAMAERIRQAVAAQSFLTTNGRDLQVTVSLGVAALPVNAHTATTLIARADEALYAAKQAGRDRVCCAEEAPEDRPAMAACPEAVLLPGST